MPFWGLARRPRPRKKNNRATSGLTGTKEKKQKKERKGDVHADYDSPHHCPKPKQQQHKRERESNSLRTFEKRPLRGTKGKDDYFSFPFFQLGRGRRSLGTAVKKRPKNLRYPSSRRMVGYRKLYTFRKANLERCN